MTALLFVLAAYAAYFVWDLRSSLKSKKPRIVWPCLVFFCVAFIVQALFEMNFPAPSPAAPISGFVSTVFNLPR